MPSSTPLSFIRVFLAVCCLSLAVMGVVAKRGVLDWRRMVRQNQEISNKIATLQLEKEKWQMQTDSLETDVGAQERSVRTVLGYVQPNEVVIEFE